MLGYASRLIADRGGAVAPTIALSLVALIAVGGIAFDYARMASLDTELQNAADQAALAGASQLDGQPGACARAAAAARNMITNLTYMANEPGGTNPITIANEPACDATGNVRFYQNITKTQAATLDENAKFIEVTVDSRRAYFALTPIVNAMQSGPLNATAFAGMGEAICRVPPLMMCNPDENADPDFTVANYVGKGIRLVANDGGGSYGPGLFGFLEVGQGNGANALRTILGRQGDPGNCSEGNGVEPNPGNMESLRDAFNTRFDMLGNGLNQACGANGDLCPPSQNSRKDLIRDGSNASACGFVSGVGGQGWREPTNVYPNLPTTTTPRVLTDGEIATVAPMGHPRDICHAFSTTGNCPGGLMGAGTWDRYAYFKSHSQNDSNGNPGNYPEVTSVATFNTFMDANFPGTNRQPTRWQVYQWEMNNAASRLKALPLGGNLSGPGTPVCNPPGVDPGPDEIDRRILSVAVINCVAEGLSPSSTNVQVTKWIDIFLVEPSVPRQRTESHDVYVEVVGESANAIEGGNFQVVKKSVPYLIE